MPLSEFLAALPITLVPLLQIFFLGFIGAALVLLRVLDRTAVDVLTRLVTQLFVPLLIFTTIVGDFRPYTPEFARWYLIPLIAIVTIGAALLLTPLAARHLCPPERRGPFVLLASIQNAGYLPLVIIEALYGGNPETAALYNRMLVLLFLFVMGQNPLLWFVGVVISRRTHHEQRSAGSSPWTLLRQGLSPPLVASVLAVGLCLASIPQRLAPQMLTNLMVPLELLADCTIPLVTLSLGAMIASLNFANRPAKREILSLVSFRLMLLPLAWLFLLESLLKAGLLTMSWAVILFFQSMTPSATNLAVMMRRYGSAEASDFVSHALMPLYLSALVTMPFWLTLWRLRVGFAP